MVSAGAYHTCALLDDFSVKCWGYNVYGALGYGDDIMRNSPPANETVDFGPLDPGVHVKAISCGLYFSCALLSDGGVRCWGDNLSGQLGQGHQVDLYSPAWGQNALLGYNFIRACEAGTFVVVVGDAGEEQCVACPAGTYSSELHSEGCTACPVGKFSNVTGTAGVRGCVDCPYGTFSARENGCVLCPPGTYSNATTGVWDRCFPCMEGSFAGKSGAVECELCAKGMATTTTNSSSGSGFEVGEM